MRVKTWLMILSIALMLAPLAATADDYDVYKNSQDGTPVPDVDKVPLPPNPGDQSCWLAAASNLLGASGWGIAGNTAQQNATAIYGHLTNHFGKANPGRCEVAINWWLLNYGYNPNAPDPRFYNPNLTYNDVTVINYSYPGILPGAGAAGPNPYGSYDWLLDELNRCQYVAVQWELPEGGYHCITLVGGDYSVNGQFQGQSVWHDSDRDQGGTNDDPYPNGANEGGGWRLPTYPTNWAPKSVLLCPGLQKPAEAIENYDYAYFRDQDEAGHEFITGRVAGEMADIYGEPYWEDTYTLWVPNEEIPEWYKIVYLLIDYTDRDNKTDPGIKLQLPEGQTLDPTSIDYSADYGQILLTWQLDEQPPFEKIIFPNDNYSKLTGDVKDWNLATICVPEPMTLTLLASGMLLLLRRRHD